MIRRLTSTFPRCVNRSIRSVLHRLQFLLQLPHRLEAALQASRLAEAVRVYLNAAPILAILATLAASEAVPADSGTGVASPELSRSFARLQADIDVCVVDMRKRLRALVRIDSDTSDASTVPNLAVEAEAAANQLQWATLLLQLNEVCFSVEAVVAVFLLTSL